MSDPRLRTPALRKFGDTFINKDLLNPLQYDTINKDDTFINKDLLNPLQ